MRSAVLFAAVLASIVIASAEYGYGNANPNKNESPIWKVFCSNLYGGRLDTIVNPGTVSAHSHRVFGGSHFGQGSATRTPVEQYNINYASPCTTCSISKVDNSNYWTADLYYRWPNNTYSLVPSGGLTVYYLSRGGSTGTQKTNPNWKPIPKGLRIVAGDPTRRTFNASIVAHQAVDYVCLNYAGKGFDQSTDWSGLKNHTCPQGLRTQVFFPMCWDGVNLDSPDHKSHMAYPQRPNGGDCPTTHPVRIPGVFFEHVYNVGDFPHGDGTNNFVWSMGDPTGYGHHGDFLSGWDEAVMAAAIAHPACSNDNPAMNFGNSVTACPPMAPFVKNGSEAKCTGLQYPVPLTENLGAQKPIARMPGCFDYNGVIAGCNKTPAGSDNSGTFFIKSASTGGYLSAKHFGIVSANWTKPFKTYSETWAFGFGGTNLNTIQNQEWFDVISARDSAQLVGGNQASTWEYWTILYMDTTHVAFKSSRNGKYMTVLSDSTMVFTATNVTNTETFILEPNSGGYVPSDDGLSPLAAVTPQSPYVPTGTARPAVGSASPDVGTSYNSLLTGSGVTTFSLVTLASVMAAVLLLL